MRFIICIVIFIALLVTASCYSYNNDLAEELSQKFNKVNSYKVNFSYKDFTSSEEEVVEGIAFYKKPNFWFFKSNDMSIYIICDGENIWMPISGTKLILRQKISAQNQLNLQQPLTIKDIKEYKTLNVEKKTTSDGDIFLFKVKTNDKKETTLSTIFSTVEVAVDSQHGLLLRLDAYDNKGNKSISQVYSNYQVNIPVEDSIFHFEIPTDAKVQDININQ